MPDTTIPAAEFKAKCLALLDRVRERGEPITITKRGRVVARLVPAGDEDERPWKSDKRAAKFPVRKNRPARRQT